MPRHADQRTPKQRAAVLVARHAARVAVFVRRGYPHTDARRMAAREMGVDVRGIERAERAIR